MTRYFEGDMMIDTILFDMDGVIVNSEPVILQAAIDGLREYKIDPIPEDFKPFVGSGENMFIGGVARKYGLEYILEMKKRVYDIYDEIVGEKIEIIDGIYELLEYLHKKKYHLAIVSSADMRKVRSNLKAVKIDEKYFETIIAGEDVEKRKPFPDIYLEAAIRLNKPPNQCLVIEDAINGIQAAKAANMKCIALTTSFDKNELSKEKPDYIFDDQVQVKKFFMDNLSTI